jgi:hypothetical protein
MIMSTLSGERLETGDVIEMQIGSEVVSALVLLASDEAVILDACDGTMPFVVERHELVAFRRFEP